MKLSARSYLLGSLALLAACSSGLGDAPTLATSSTPTTLRFSVNRASDDAEEISGRLVQLSGSILDLRAKGGVLQLTGMRFQNLQIPPDAKIEDAYIRFRAGVTDTEKVELQIYGEASSSAATFSTARDNLSSRAKTSAQLAWAPGSWTVGRSYQTPNLAPVVQEIVGRSGWSSGSALALFVNGSSSAGERSALAFGNPYGPAPELFVTYSAGGADAPTTPDAPTTASAGGTLTFKVAGTKDDAEEGSSVVLSGKALDFSQNQQTVGLRFTGVGLPQGAKIKAATIGFTAIADDSAPVNLQVQAEASDTAAPFSGSFKARAKTSVAALWQPKAWTRGLAVRTSDLSNVVQEVVSRGGWESGNALAFYVTGDRNAKRSAYSFDAGSKYAAVLRVTYEAPPAAPAPAPAPAPTPTPEPAPAPAPEPAPTPSGSCLSSSAPLVTLTGDYPSRVTVRYKSAGVRVDAHDARFLNLAGPRNSSFLADYNGGSFCLAGGYVDIGLSDTDAWDTFHSAAGLLFYNTPNAVVENVTVHQTGDGITFKDNNPNWVFRDSYVRHAGDDGVENDRFNDGLVDDVLIDWAYTGLSCRKEGDYIPKAADFEVRNSLIALRPQKGTYGGGSVPKHSELFKMTKSTTTGCTLTLKNNVFLISGWAGYVDPADDPAIGYDPLNRAACQGNRNTIVYVGSDPYYLNRLREAAPECFDVTTDIGVWKAARAKWFDRHPGFSEYRNAEPTGYLN